MMQQGGFPNQQGGMQQQQQQQQYPAQVKENSLYVGNIAWRTTEQEIGDTFANFGSVKSVRIITDKETGRSKGFGFVEYAPEAQGQHSSMSEYLHTVISQMQGYNLNGRQLRVNMAAGVQQNQNNGMGGGRPGGNRNFGGMNNNGGGFNNNQGGFNNNGMGGGMQGGMQGGMNPMGGNNMAYGGMGQQGMPQQGFAMAGPRM